MSADSSFKKWDSSRLVSGSLTNPFQVATWWTKKMNRVILCRVVDYDGYSRTASECWVRMEGWEEGESEDSLTEVERSEASKTVSRRSAAVCLPVLCTR